MANNPLQKEKPIIFTTEMVKAILDGRKSMTRRIVKPQPTNPLTIITTLPDGEFLLEKWPEQPRMMGNFGRCERIKSKYQPGDIMWVREKFRKYILFDPGEENLKTDEIIDFAGEEPIPMIDGDGCQIFNKDGSERFIPYHSARFMPKSAARIWLECTGVKVERLLDISQEDARSEGTFTSPHRAHENCGKWLNPMNNWHDCHYCSFKVLWQKINGAESWKANPWVFVYSFDVLSTTGKPNSNSPCERSVATAAQSEA